MDIIENCKCRLNGGFALSHNKCPYCLHSWCPKATGLDWCPNPQCAHGVKGNNFQPYDENYTWIKCRCGMWFQRTVILDAIWRFIHIIVTVMALLKEVINNTIP
jgi:hypothetical protein